MMATTRSASLGEREVEPASYSSFSMSEQSDIDQSLLRFARIAIADRRPRNVSGEVYVWKEGNVACAHKSDSLETTLNKLVKENFLSMPVLDEWNRYSGVISMEDILVYICDLFSGTTSSAWTDFFEKRSEFRSKLVADVMKAGGRWSRAVDPFYTFLEGYSLLHAFEVLARTGCHRTPVVNEFNRIVGIYTESMGVSDIRQQMYMLGPIGDLKVRDCMQSSRIITARESDKAIDVLRLMVANNISGVPLVDDNGVLTSVMSSRDIRAVGPTGESFSRLFLTCREFREQSRRVHPLQGSQTHWSSRTVPRGALYVTPSSTLRDVVDKMNDGNLHRVVVVSQRSHDESAPLPIAVITQRDVIAQVLISCGTMRAGHLKGIVP